MVEFINMILWDNPHVFSIKGTVFLILQILNFFKIYLTDTVGGGGGEGESMLDFEVL